MFLLLFPKEPSSCFLHELLVSHVAALFSAADISQISNLVKRAPKKQENKTEIKNSTKNELRYRVLQII